MFTDHPAFWGALGSVIYAVPRLTACVYSGEPPVHIRRCYVEGITAVMVGTITAAAFQPWLAGYLHAAAPKDARAMSFVIGMLANTTAPGVINFLSQTILNRVRGGH